MKSVAQLASILLLVLAAGCHAQSASDPFRMVFSYDRPGLAVPHWQISVPPRGPAEYTATPSQAGVPGEVNFPVSAAGRAKLGTLLQRSNGLQPCETRAKNLANMGAKAVRYVAGAAPEVQCTFNYTENKPLSEVADYAIAMANTIQTGLELDRLHRYDRLGMDAVMTRLALDVKSGRAVEIGAIRPTLESITADMALMDRVRGRAQQLLELAKAETPAAPETAAAQ